MRKLSITLVASALLVAGLAVAQAPSPTAVHYDVSAEWKDIPADPNNLPIKDASRPALILDSQVFYGFGIGGATMVPVNEYVMPELYPDGDGGRTRSIILPGTQDIRAEYGEWRDYDADLAIDYTNDTDPENEWVFAGHEATNITGVKAYVKPGYYPPVTSDCYILAGFVVDNGCRPGDNSTDFEYSYSSRGQWIAVLTFFSEGSLLTEITIETVAAGIDTQTAPGYECGSNSDCLVDVDEYNVLDENVAELYALTLEVADAAVDEAISIVNDALPDETPADPVLDIVDPVVGEALNTTFDAIINGQRAILMTDPAESDPAGPHPSMPSDPNVAGYGDRGHGYMDVKGYGYYDAGGLGTLSFNCCTMPLGPGPSSKGFAPVMLGVQGLVGEWHDKDVDHVIDLADEEWQGTCDVVRTSDSSVRSGFNVTLQAVDDHGNPTSWGTTGVYVANNGGDALNGPEDPVFGIELLDWGWLDDLAADALDLTIDRHVLFGEITLTLDCDQSDANAGDYFSNGVVILPEGTNGFNIRAVSESDVGVRVFDPVVNDFVLETLQDVDLYESWS